jgi:uncharacterized protein YhfF|tara:strand:+ start:574 stop:798 length:225 start_codon:yes stop_codon:yes gene_type:complete
MTYQDYENELLQNINHYTVTQHLGRGQYNKIDCIDLEHANNIKQQIIDGNKSAKVAIYAVCKPKSRPLVNVIVG